MLSKKVCEKCCNYRESYSVIRTWGSPDSKRDPALWGCVRDRNSQSAFYSFAWAVGVKDDFGSCPYALEHFMETEKQ